MKTNKGLGRGLSALISDAESSYANAQHYDRVDVITEEEARGILELKLSSVIANPNQPRKTFDESALDELADSIKKHGVITPIVVSKTDDGKFMIIAGERRWRAAKRAKIDAIPAVVREYSEREIKEISLIENLQREDLNPIEAAAAMKQLMDEYSLTQEELAQCVGKSRPAVANTLRLLTLCDEVIELVKEGDLSSGHARALVPLTDEQQKKVAKSIVREGLSVRDVERRVRDIVTPPEVKAAGEARKKQQISIELSDFVGRMRNVFKTKVSLIGNDKKGRIYIDYYNRADLDRINDIISLSEKEDE